jgi:putative membrane protein
MFYMHGSGWGWGWWLLMSIGMVAFWGLIIYGIVWLVRGRPTDVREETPRERPDEILKRRLARGEISIDEYNELHAAINDGPHEPVSADNGRSTTSVT